MTPESEPSFGALVKVFSVPEKVFESVRSVVEAVEPPDAESVVPSNVSPDPTRSVFTPAMPFPARIPESVVEPVPPYTPESVVDAKRFPEASEVTRPVVRLVSMSPVLEIKKTKAQE
jgi:hypothetical protein